MTSTPAEPISAWTHVPSASLKHRPVPLIPIPPQMGHYERIIVSILQDAYSNAPYISYFLHDHYECTVPKNFDNAILNGWKPIPNTNGEDQWTHPLIEYQGHWLFHQILEEFHNGEYLVKTSGAFLSPDSPSTEGSDVDEELSIISHAPTYHMVDLC